MSAGRMGHPRRKAKKRGPKWCDGCARSGHEAHAKDGNTTLVLVGGPKPYVWIGIEHGELDRVGGQIVGSVDGRLRLRNFAREILRVTSGAGKGGGRG